MEESNKVPEESSPIIGYIREKFHQSENSRLYDVLAKCKEEANLKFWINF